MKRYFTIVITLIFSVGMLGCGGSKPQVDIQPQKQPSWYTHPPRSDAQTLYGVGDGVDKQAALKDALNNVLGTLSLSLSSEYDAKTVVKEGIHESSSGEYKTHIHAQVQKIRITNYEVLQTQKLGFKHYGVLVKVDKQRFYETLKKEVQQKFHYINEKEKTVAKQSVLKRFFFYKKALSSLEELPNTLLVMDTLNPHATTKDLLSMYVALQKKYDEALSRVVFRVEANKEGRFLVGVIKEGISKEHFKVAKHKAKGQIVTQLSLGVEYAHAYGFHIARGVLTLNTQDEFGNHIGSNVVHINGQSSQSKAIAKEDIAKRLGKKIEKEGIVTLLNLSI